MGVEKEETFSWATKSTGRASILAASSARPSLESPEPKMGFEYLSGTAALMTSVERLSRTYRRESALPHHQVGTEGSRRSSPRRWRERAGRNGKKAGAWRTPVPRELATATVFSRTAWSKPGTPRY